MASIDLIKKLRDRTGAGLMECKKALEVSGDDVDKACDYLREQGIVKSAKKADRIAAEGIANIVVDGDTAIILELNCETDFVAKNEKFKDLVNNLSKGIIEKNVATVEEANKVFESLFADATIALGEKLSLRRFDIVRKNPNECFGSYMHLGGKVSSVVILNKEDKELAFNVAVHIASNNPLYICENCVPKEVIDKEKAIALEASKSDPKLAGKPAQMVEKIIEGKVKKGLADSILLEQLFVFDQTKKVGQLLKEKDVVVVKFIRYQVGEGIEKRVDDFVNEVMKESK